nr:unnamed protein product [Spirometra erinaceieuropaei]
MNYRNISKRFYYCYADKRKTRALTYIIDWRGSSKPDPGSATNTQLVQQTATSGAEKLISRLAGTALSTVDDIRCFSLVTEGPASRICDAREAKLKQKLTTLCEKNPNLCHDNVVHNLSSKQLTAEQMKVLSHDACFNTTDAQPLDFIAAAESVIREAAITEESRNLLRQRISSRLMSHKQRKTLSKAEDEALRTLKADKSIVILPADKGRSTVVMNKEDYTNKVDELLGDRTAYIPREGDTTKTLISEINKHLASLRKSKVITQLDWLRMKPKDSAIARFYGLPKVHKPGTPLRPIVSLRGTPTFGLAKWLFQRLKFLTQGSETSVHSAERFIEKLQGIRLTDDEVMVSFDVISLFTSIPQHLAVETLQTLLEEQYDETDKKLKIKHLIDLLKHCLKTFFTFNGAVYEQVKVPPLVVVVVVVVLLLLLLLILLFLLLLFLHLLLLLLLRQHRKF